MPQKELPSREDRANEAIAAYLAAVEQGQAPDRDKFLAEHADLAAELNSFFANWSQFRQVTGSIDAVEANAAAEESKFLAEQTNTFHAEPLEPAASPTGQPESAPFGKNSILPVGTTLGRYVVVRCLGRGGFGAVYLARDEELRRSVAVKVPRLDKSVSTQQVEQMLQEARTAAQLRHPGIVSVFDSGRNSDGNPYLVMEYVMGRPLDEMLKIEPVTRERAVELVAEIADATHFAHLHGFVHRDLKPGNILIDTDGRPRLTDFGMAVHENEQRARAGEFAGTLSYMAPEQVRGEVHHIDGRTDIWGLGVILYRLLTGRLPFGGNKPAEIIDEILNREPKPLRQIDDQIPADLEAACLKCLAKEITDRYTTARDVAEALHGHLERASASTGSRVPTPGNGEKRVELVTRMGRYGCSVSMALTVCLLVIPTAIVSLMMYKSLDQAPPRPKSKKHGKASGQGTPYDGVRLFAFILAAVPWGIALLCAIFLLRWRLARRRREAFTGRWKIVNDKGVVGAYFTLDTAFTAKKSNVPGATGKWEIVGEEARITWSDGWKDILRPKKDRIAKIAFGPGKSWDDKPDDSQFAVKE